jgi:hypothetical protein
MATNKIRLGDLFRYYKALPHQMAAITELEQAINKANPNILGRDQGWFKTWSVAGKQTNFPNTWEGILEAARVAGAKFPELVAAQWALESAYGKLVSGRNNFFGLKGSGSDTKTQEFINNQWVTITDSFIDFPDLLSCVIYLVDHWYKDFKTYKGCNNASTRDEAAKWLVKEGYATDPNYAGKLIELMNQHAGTNPPVKPKEKILKVAYEYQLGPDDGATGYRQCFSSSCAMVARYYGKISGDYEYNKLRARFGDTTDPKAQIAALKALGLTATFEMDGTVEDLENEISNSHPVPVGWLHKGPVSNPSGTGHWSVVVGFTPTHFIHNDPYGEANLVSGGYVSHKGGAGVAYSRKNWLPRWLIEGDDTGWFLKVRPR